jgi:hypothetical protein
MPYDKKKIYKEVLHVIDEHKLKHFDYIEGFVAPCTKTLYDLFPTGSNELHTIKKALDKNKINTKVKLVNNWEDSENPTLQIAAFKLIATPEEHKKLSQNYTDVTTNNESLNVQPIIVSNEEQKVIIDSLFKKE